jgi:hypothetical protein
LVVLFLLIDKSKNKLAGLLGIVRLIDGSEGWIAGAMVWRCRWRSKAAAGRANGASTGQSGLTDNRHAVGGMITLQRNTVILSVSDGNKIQSHGSEENGQPRRYDSTMGCNEWMSTTVILL